MWVDATYALSGDFLSEYGIGTKGAIAVQALEAALTASVSGSDFNLDLFGGPLVDEEIPEGRITNETYFLSDQHQDQHRGRQSPLLHRVRELRARNG